MKKLVEHGVLTKLALISSGRYAKSTGLPEKGWTASAGY